MELEKVCGECNAIGDWVRSGNCQDPFGTQHINLDDEKTIGFMETPIDTSLDVDCSEQNLREYFVGTTKRIMPSSSKGPIQTKKSKMLVDDC
ncbi:hypothetical protein MA16_Dca024048 [Dendrobium catenatum]|uniref:Uncharacterized protein n=1 Tax=Dendrobium catenatum TaxID=906689 RepID=A0A2I0VG32_9ASPA|nr:hypothetical protein MA16_Dca024048 [Dendrobium catenatum]